MKIPTSRFIPASGLLCCLCLVAWPKRAPAQENCEGRATLSGYVVSGATGQAVADAVVKELSSERKAVTDSAGWFRLCDLPGHVVSLQVRYSGFSSDSFKLRLRAGKELSVKLTTVVTPYAPLPGLTVSVSPAHTVAGKLAGFRRRKDTGFGYYITEEDLARRHPERLSDMLRGVAGLSVGRSQLGATPVASIRSNCTMEYFLDGLRATGLSVDDLRPEDVVGIEIYHGASRTPVQFVRRGYCGAIVIWTKDPGEQGLYE